MATIDNTGQMIKLNLLVTVKAAVVHVTKAKLSMKFTLTAKLAATHPP